MARNGRYEQESNTMYTAIVYLCLVVITFLPVVDAGECCRSVNGLKTYCSAYCCQRRLWPGGSNLYCCQLIANRAHTVYIDEDCYLNMTSPVNLPIGFIVVFVLGALVIVFCSVAIYCCRRSQRLRRDGQNNRSDTQRTGVSTVSGSQNAAMYYNNNAGPPPAYSEDPPPYWSVVGPEVEQNK